MASIGRQQILKLRFISVLNIDFVIMRAAYWCLVVCRLECSPRNGGSGFETQWVHNLSLK